MDSTNPNLRALLNRFFAAGTHSRTKDQVFTLQHTLLEVKVAREDDNYIYWGDNGQLPKKDIAAIIYADGKSKLFCSNEQAATILGTCERTPLNLGIGKDMVAEKEPAAQESVIAVNTSAAAPGNENGNNDSIANARINALLAGVPRKEFEEKAEKKTAQFTDYLKILCNKTASYEELDKAVNQAVTLFVNEDAMVEVSSNNRNSIMQLKVRDYLKKVKQIQYDRIEVKWTHVQYVNDLKLGPDGNLYGTVSFEQEFRGYRDGKMVYSDVTLKHANVVLKTYNKTFEGETKKIWDVLLSDVGVVATKTM
jgi:hypothetical protein